LNWFEVLDDANKFESRIDESCFESRADGRVRRGEIFDLSPELYQTAKRGGKGVGDGNRFSVILVRVFECGLHRVRVPEGDIEIVGRGKAVLSRLDIDKASADNNSNER
jgi:hypothetical protein